MNARCSALTNLGVPCPKKAVSGSAHCLQHAARAGEAFAMETLRLRAQRGGREAMRKLRKGEEPETLSLAEVDLRSTAGMFDVLERRLVHIVNSAADATAKVDAAAKLVAQARALLKDAVLESENAELRDIIAEKHPELARQLKVVK